MNFTLQFTEQYKNQSKFATVVFLEGEESSMLRIKTLDSDLKQFISSLIDENTVIMLLSDQGVWFFDVPKKIGNYQSEYFETPEGKYEHKRPFSYIIVPSSMVSTGIKIKGK